MTTETHADREPARRRWDATAATYDQLGGHGRITTAEMSVWKGLFARVLDPVRHRTFDDRRFGSDSRAQRGWFFQDSDHGAGRSRGQRPPGPGGRPDRSERQRQDDPAAHPLRRAHPASRARDHRRPAGRHAQPDGGGSAALRCAQRSSPTPPQITRPPPPRCAGSVPATSPTAPSTRCPAGRSSACSSPAPSPRRPTTCCSTSPPTISTSATSTRSCPWCGRSTSPPWSCCTTSTSPRATAITSSCSTVETVACSGPTDAVLTSEVLEPVYGIGVRRLVEPDCVQLIFQPHGSTATNGTEETR